MNCSTPLSVVLAATLPAELAPVDVVGQNLDDIDLNATIAEAPANRVSHMRSPQIGRTIDRHPPDDMEIRLIQKMRML